MNTITKIAIQILGLAMIFFGIIGLFLPFLQGIIFLVIGLALLSIASSSFKSKIDRILEPHPRTKAHFNRHHEKLKKMFDRPQ
jgi:uncharacterized membrane protein YbaN (DUF454 family)